jgi:hypothetical protein
LLVDPRAFAVRHAAQEAWGNDVTATKSAFRDPCFVVTFSKTGGGKTVDQVAAFPHALVFSITRELKSAITVLDYHPSVVEVHNLYEVDAKVNELLTLRAQKNKNALAYTAVIIDDISILAYKTEIALREGVRVNGNLLKPKGWDLWTEQRNEALMISFTIAEKLKQAGVHCAVNGHVRVGRTNNAGKFYRGGVDLATDLSETFTAGADMAAMIVEEPERLWHQTLFMVKNHDAAWATKNRFSLPEKVPSNTGELLRAAGYALPRPPGHESYESVVEQLAQYIGQAFVNGAPMSRENLRAVLSEPTKQVSSIVSNPLHVRWIIRDAVDRAWIRREKSRSIFVEVGVGT